MTAENDIVAKYETEKADSLLALARWPISSEHCWRTSDFLSYWPGLACGVSTIAKK